MNEFFTLISTIVIFAIMITIHEFGHFISAKLSKIRVDEFAVGMGPAIFKKQKGETLYSLRIIPFGGYCKLEGENELWDTSTSFSAKPRWIRFIVLVAGSFMNILLGLVLAIILFSSQPYTITNVVDEISPNSAVDIAGMQQNDRIIKVNGQSVHSYRDLMNEFAKINAIKTSDEKNVVMDVENNNAIRTLNVKPLVDESGILKFGFGVKSEPTSFISVIKDSYYETVGVIKLVYWSFAQLISRNISANDLSGPVGIISAINSAVSASNNDFWLALKSLIMMTILLTVNLGVMNLLPIPGLDGGRILFLLIEAVRRKPIPAEKEAWVHFAGFAFLIILSVFVLYNDVVKIMA